MFEQNSSFLSDYRGSYFVFHYNDGTMTAGIY